jgi:hypothetical protein
MEAKDCAGYFQTLASNDGFSLDVGVLQTIEELSLAAQKLETWTNGRTLKTLWGETKLQVAQFGVSNNHTNPYHSQDEIPTWTNGRTMKALCGETKLQVAQYSLVCPTIVPTHTTHKMRFRR